MSNVRICLKDETVKLVANEAKALWLPFREQPQFWNEHNRTYFYKSDRPISPVQPGDTVFLLETWRIWSYNKWSGTGIIEYKIDSEKKLINGFGWNNRSLQRGTKWLSPCTMPNIACRWKWIINKIEAVQLKQLDIIEIQKIMGCNENPEIMEDFDAHIISVKPDVTGDSWGWYFEKGD